MYSSHLFNSSTFGSADVYLRADTALAHSGLLNEEPMPAIVVLAYGPIHVLTVSTPVISPPVCPDSCPLLRLDAFANTRPQEHYARAC